MDRRELILGMGLVLASAGCARVAPSAVEAASATPTAAPMMVGSDGSVVADALAALYAGALVGSGVPATTTVVGVADVVPTVESGTVRAFPVFAARTLAGLSTDDEPTPPDEVVTNLATLLHPGVAVIRPSGVDGHLVYAVSQETAKAGITSLSDLSGPAATSTLVGPTWLDTAPDGTPGLKAVYQAAFAAVQAVADPAERTRMLSSGEALVAAYRAPELPNSPALSRLADPELLILPDPQVVLVTSSVADDEDVVLALDSVQEALTTEGLAGVVAQILGGSSPTAAAGAWLTAAGLSA